MPAKDRATCGPGSRRRRAGRPFSTEEPRWVLSELISLRKTETAFVAGAAARPTWTPAKED
ncbi:hypothetical protein [Mycobacteroides abscessus]|uniref:hypothetical protein n=1 Tax=Mycobacteroides abscessus TaxID=36809 RepID=UPI0013000F6D|nr:hypothetical protein [Mycobacteroides abscessus]